MDQVSDTESVARGGSDGRRATADRMVRLPRTLFRSVLKTSASHQLFILVLTVAVFLIELVPLELQRGIINDLVKIWSTTFATSA